MLFTIQLIIILICLFYGARKGGIALGLLGGIGLVILVFVFIQIFTAEPTEDTDRQDTD